MENNHNEIFDLEFLSDEEIEKLEEEGADEFIDSIGDILDEEENSITILNPLRMKQMQFSYSILRYIAKSTGAKISYLLQEPFKSMGSISIEGRLLEFDKPELFLKAAEFASNMEVYPLTTNKVRMSFAFHNLTTPV